MEGLKELLISFVAKTQNKSAEEVSSLLFDKGADNSEVLKADALNNLLEKDKVRAQGFSAEIKTAYDKGHKEGLAKGASKVESEIKSVLNITEDVKGEEFISAVTSAISKTAASNIDEEKIKASKLYLDTISNLKKEKENAVKEWEQKFNDRETQLKKESTFKTVLDKGLSFIKNDLNPILPEDAKKAENQLSIVANQLKDYDYEVKDDGKIVVFDKDGKVLVDGHGHPISYEDLVKSKASQFWDFKKAEKRSGTGNNNDGAGGNGNENKGYKGPIPKTGEEFTKILNELKTDEEKMQLSKIWAEEKTKQQ